LPDSVVVVAVALVLAGVLGSPVKLGDAEVAAPGGWWSRIILIVAGAVLGIVWNVRRAPRAWSSAEVNRARTNLLGSMLRRLEDELHPITGVPVVPLAVQRQPVPGRASRRVDVMRDEDLLALFGDFGPSLVITGRPGCGKSTLAAALGLALARRARDDLDAPVPVLVELNRLGQSELSALIETTLTSEHHVPAPVARDWVAGAAVLPILDGLDETGRPIDEVIDMIERTRRAGVQSIVVCCRSDVYGRASQPLEGTVGVEICDLEPDQIESFLREVGGAEHSGSALAEAVADLPELRTVLGLRIAASDQAPEGSVCGLLSSYVRHLVRERTSQDPQEVELFLAGIARVMSAAEVVPEALRLYHVRSPTVDRVAWLAAGVHGGAFAVLGFGLGRIVDRPSPAWVMAAVFAVVGTLTGAVLWDLYDGHRRTSVLVQAEANGLDEGLGLDTVLGNALFFFALGVVYVPIGALAGLLIGLVTTTGPLWLVVVECTVALWVAQGAAFSLGHAICVLFERMQWSTAPYFGGKTRSLRSILVSGLVAAVVVWLLAGPWGLGRILPTRAEPWITAGALATWLLLLIDLAGQNLLTRALLARRNQVPFRLWRFLDAMIVAGAMRPVPRGAAFFHRLYYECLTNTKPTDAEPAS
jgi:hypothetical protein